MAKFHGKNARAYIDGYDMSGYANSISVDQSADIVDVASFGDTKKNYVVGLYDSEATHDGFFDDTVDVGSHKILSDRLGSSVNAMFLIGTAPGAHGFAGSASLENTFSVEASIGGAVVYKTKLSNSGTQGLDPTIQIASRGTLGAAGTTEAVATTPSATGGGRAYIQNFGSYGDVGAGNIGTVWLIGGAQAAFSSGTAIIASFGLQGTAPSASGLAFTGTAQFMKLLMGGGTFRPQVAVAVDIN